MRVDHFAYQRAARVAGLGLLLQFVIATMMLVFGLMANDTVLFHSSGFIYLGCFIWVSLLLLFHQQKLTALEDLEVDELAARRGRTGSAFDQDDDELRVAGRRLKLMHKWLMPIFSIALALTLAFLAWGVFRFYSNLDNPTADATDFLATAHRGWAVAICLGAALVSFIFSRFVAGMAKQSAWQNLRGGAGYMVGTALLLLAVSVGIVFRFFENEDVNKVIGRGIPVYMLVVAAEILMNFVLNIYRPRVAGEIPRPAFDSKVLSLLSAPDNIVRSLNEAVNYQFGFDITSSWGYQLLLRSFTWLVVFAVVVLLALSTIVVVEPHQQAVRLRHGKLVQVFDEPGLWWKLPWPLETVEVYDVRRLRELALTTTQLPRAEDSVARLEINLWTTKLRTAVPLDPFVVGSSRGSMGAASGGDAAAGPGDDGEVDEATSRLSASYSLVDAILIMKYRINDLEKYLKFSSSDRRRRDTITMRERALKDMALRAATQKFSRTPYDAVISHGRADMLKELREAIQQEFNDRDTGVEVVLVEAPTLRPPSDAAAKYGDLFSSRVYRQSMLEEARTIRSDTLVGMVGDLEEAEKIVEAIDQLLLLSETISPDAPEVTAQRQVVHALIREAGGGAASMIQAAETARWKRVMDQRERSMKTGGDVYAYNAAPRLYKYRAFLKMLQRELRTKPKFIIAFDPERLKVDVSFTESNPLFSAQDALSSEDISK